MSTFQAVGDFIPVFEEDVPELGLLTTSSTLHPLVVLAELDDLLEFDVDFVDFVLVFDAFLTSDSDFLEEAAGAGVGLSTSAGLAMSAGLAAGGGGGVLSSNDGGRRSIVRATVLELQRLTKRG